MALTSWRLITTVSITIAVAGSCFLLTKCCSNSRASLAARAGGSSDCTSEKLSELSASRIGARACSTTCVPRKTEVNATPSAAPLFCHSLRLMPAAFAVDAGMYPLELKKLSTRPDSAAV